MAEYIKCRNCESPDCKGCNIKRLETMLENGKFDCMMNENRCINTSADVEPVQEWIPVDDRLPEEGDYVLCVLKGFNYGGKIQVCKFVPADKFKDKPYFEHFRNGFPSVTHWMPIPQTPKGE